MRYNVNVVGLGLFLLAVGAGYLIGGWKVALLVFGVLGCIKAGRLFWLAPRDQNGNGEV